MSVGPYQEMVDLVERQVCGEWATQNGALVEFENRAVQKPEPSAGASWWGATVDHSGTEQLCMGRSVRYRKRATLRLGVRGPLGSLAAGRNQASDAASSFPPGLRDGVIWEPGHIEQVGREGAWFRWDAVIPLYVDDDQDSDAGIAAFAPVTFGSTLETIRERMCSTVSSVLPVRTLWGNESVTDVPDVSETWCMVWADFGSSTPESLGLGAAIESSGLTRVQVYSPLGSGHGPGLAVCDAVVRRFRNTSDQGVRLGTPYLQSVGKDGAWWRHDTLVPFSVVSAVA